MAKSDNIFLIGPMGAGKTSVAKQLARMTKFDYFDTDEEIQKRTGVSVSWIFEVETEDGFRKREAGMIDELTKMNRIILSTGGGCVTTPENCEALKERGYVIYLTVNLDQQVERTSRHRGHRPLIDYPDARDRLIQLNAEREPLYKATADCEYSTDDQSPRGVAWQIYQDYLEFTGQKED
jgi:shikimate kinase